MLIYRVETDGYLENTTKSDEIWELYPLEKKKTHSMELSDTSTEFYLLDERKKSIDFTVVMRNKSTKPKQ